MIDWRSGYTSSWRVFRVNPDTWADGSAVENVSSVSFETTTDEDAPLLGRGSMTVDVPVGSAFDEGYYRVVLTAHQGGSMERVNVCTLLCSTTEGDINKGVDVRDVQGRSVLYPASVMMLEDGSYAPAGVNGARWCADVLRGCINAPIVVRGGFTLVDHHVFDPGTYALTAIWDVLNAGNHVIRIAGDGTVTILPMPSEPTITLDSANARLLHPGIHHSLDYSEVPNRYKVVDGSVSVVAVNDDPDSVTSIPYRGWVHDKRDESPIRVNGETHAAYAARRLEEESTVKDSRTYSREWWPDLAPFDVVRGSLASVDMDGDLRVMRQAVTCGVGITVEEESYLEVKTWQRT